MCIHPELKTCYELANVTFTLGVLKVNHAETFGHFKTLKAFWSFDFIGEASICVHSTLDARYVRAI